MNLEMTEMKNIQVIDDALNCTYSIFAAEDNEFEILFPDGTDIEFNDDLFSRVGEVKASEVLGKVWKRPVDKKSLVGIHGTLFYGMSYRKKYYPTKRDSEMKVVL
ncbi:MAG: hypothetical protein WCD76_00645 [Pyrinomonadaceae bacterium]